MFRRRRVGFLIGLDVLEDGCDGVEFVVEDSDLGLGIRGGCVGWI